MVVLKIASINVRGLNNSVKRRKLFNYLQDPEHNYDIVFIQETHSTKGNEKLWKNQWGGRIYYSHGTHNARGTAILIRKNVNIKIKFSHKQKTDSGRFIALECEFEHINLILASIYAPNDDQPDFYKEIFNTLSSIPIDSKIIGGDLNTVFDLELDKKGGRNVHTNKMSRDVIFNFMRSENLIDIWREQHPDEKIFTWYRRNPSLVMTRLDYFLVTNTLARLIDSSRIQVCYVSDHSLIDIKIEIANSVKGRSFWRLNTSILNDPEYRENVEQEIKEILASPFNDIRSKWNFLKFRIKEISIAHSARKNKARNNKLAALEKKLNYLQDRVTNSDFYNLTESILNSHIQQIEKIKLDIDDIMTYKAKGAMIRSRANWYQLGEKPTKYFLKLEQANYVRKNRFRLIVNGQLTTDQKEILNAQKEFYEKLYEYQEIEYDKNYLKGLQAPAISYLQRASLDAPITILEIQKAVNDMKLDKTPGADGLPIEFYHSFWNSIQKLFCDMILEIADQGMSIDQGRGIISLLEKPNKDMTKLESWRPLSLLGVDYKIYSKILANRLYTVLPDIINADQVGFLKNRNIGENIMDLLSCLEHAKINELDCVLVAADIEKAFDSTNWETMYSFMEFFGFGVRFLNYIRMLQINSTSCTVNNGYSSNWFDIKRSLRQGCCLSPPLFLIFVEILGLKIRQNGKIEGIRIRHVHKKQSQFADDQWAALINKQTVLDAYTDELSKFAAITGLKINYDKTLLMRFGSLRESNAKYFMQKPISWSQRVCIRVSSRFRR